MNCQGRYATLEVGQKVILEFIITEEEQIAFANLSGDHNPIHVDSNYAATQGYARPIVFGALLVAKLSQIIGLSLPGPAGLWSSLQVDFRRPLLVGELASMEVELVQLSEATRSLILKLVVRTADKLIATGQSMATLHSPKTQASTADSRAVLVTGATGGIGEAVCRQLVIKGLQPIIAYRSTGESSAHRLANECKGIPLFLDLSDPASVDQAVTELNGNVVGVVHCASPAPRLSPFGRISDSDMKMFWQVNVLGAHRLFAGMVKKFFRKSQRGTIVAVTSKAMGELNQPAMAGMGAYTISKFGLCGVLALLEAEFTWLKVATVCPGFTQTKMLQAFDERFIEQISAQAPLLQPSEVAAEILSHFKDEVAL